MIGRKIILDVRSEVEKVRQTLLDFSNCLCNNFRRKVVDAVLKEEEARRIESQDT